MTTVFPDSEDLNVRRNRNHPYDYHMLKVDTLLSDNLANDLVYMQKESKTLKSSTLSSLPSTTVEIFSLLSFALLSVDAQTVFSAVMQKPIYGKYFDVQGHRSGRGESVENTILAFAWALIDGVTTLELDSGITKDGVAVVWHDEQITGTKCQDTKPATPDDPSYPYVGKHIANLTLAQIKILDCGWKRLDDYPLQLTYPGVKISTLSEVFGFVKCADSKRQLLWNVGSKINPPEPNITRSVEDFVEIQHAEFIKSGYKRDQITYQSFDWRGIIAMKAKDKDIITSALVSLDTVDFDDNSTSPWLAGIRMQEFPGDTLGEKIANAAKETKAAVLSPSAVSLESKAIDPALPGYVPFTTKEMITRAHELGLTVRPWTVNRLNIAEQLIEWGVDGIISDYPHQMRSFAEHRGGRVAPRLNKDKVLKCLPTYLKKQSS